MSVGLKWWARFDSNEGRPFGRQIYSLLVLTTHARTLIMEGLVGIAPTNDSFADYCLTSWRQTLNSRLPRPTAVPLLVLGR